jgi:hypothetical protein
MAGGAPTFVELCVAGSMITSNGWLDVLLYSLTRRALIFGPENMDEQTTALDTFRLRPDQAYGVTTTIEANRLDRRPSSRHARKGSRQLRLDGGHSRDGSTEELVGVQGVKTQTIVQTSIEPVELTPIGTRGRPSFDSRSLKSSEK